MTKTGCATSLTKAISVGVISLLVLGQLSDLQAAGQAGSPMKLNLVIIEGEGAINNVQRRVARKVIVEVDDEINRPVGGVVVTFGVPASGPGGTFEGGTNLLSVVTDANGRATAGFTPNAVAGAFALSVSASLQALRATATISQSNSAAPPAAETARSTAAGATTGGISATTVAIIVGAAAAAVAIGVVASRKGGGNSNPGPSGPTVGIGGATPSLGAPGGYAQSTLQTHPIPKWRD